MGAGALRVTPAGDGVTLEVDTGAEIVSVALPMGAAETFTLQLIEALGGEAVALDVVRAFLAGVCIVAQVHQNRYDTARARTIAEWAQEGVNQPDSQLAVLLSMGRETLQAAADLEADDHAPCGLCKRCRQERERGGCN